MLNIDNLTKPDLVELRAAIDAKLSDFWTDVDAIAALEYKRDKVTADYNSAIDKIKKDSPEINGMEELGYAMVNYRKGEVGFVNYSIKGDDTYTGVKYTEASNSISFENMIPPKEEDIKKIKNILGVSELSKLLYIDENSRTLPQEAKT